MNINTLRTKMNDFLDQLEKEEKKVCNIKSFQDATKEEIKEYLDLHYNGDIDLSDYWKVGDKRVEESGATYILVNYEQMVFSDDRSFTIMRTDLIDLECRMRDDNTCRPNLDYFSSVTDKILSTNAHWILGDTFCELARTRFYSYVHSIYRRLLWLPSASEVFGDKVSTNVEKDGEQFEYFRKQENRQLGSWWWTRSGFLDGGYAYFDGCRSDGLRGSHYASGSCYGLAPCFYI